MERRIVCAANKCIENPSWVILGVRHWDSHMTRFLPFFTSMPEHYTWKQGFFDNRGNFLTRQEAWVVAEAAGQIIRSCGGDADNGGTLYTENLY